MATASPRWTTPADPSSWHRHLGWSFGLELGLGAATAFGGGQAYSLSALNGGRSVTPVSFVARAARTVAEDLRLGLVVGGTVSGSNDSGLSSTAAVGRVDAELTWLPRGDGLLLRGGAGLGWLQVGGDSSVAGREATCTGLDLTAGVGWYLAPWRVTWPQNASHLLVAADLSWQHYTSAGSLSGQVKSALAWSLRVGIDYW